MNDHDNQGNENRKTCEWCGRLIGERTWKDGKKLFCSSACHSASLFPFMIVATVLTTALIVGTVLFPQIVLGYILGPLANVLIIVIGAYIVMIILYIMFLYICYEGWQARSKRNSQQIGNDTSIEGISSYD